MLQTVENKGAKLRLCAVRTEKVESDIPHPFVDESCAQALEGKRVKCAPVVHVSAEPFESKGISKNTCSFRRD